MGSIDIHAHLGPRWDDVKDVRAGRDDLYAAAAEADVELCVASSAESLLSRSPLGAADDASMERRLEAGNEALLAALAGRPWLAMTVVVDPLRKESLGQAGEMLRDPKVVGVKLHPDRHRYRVGDHAEAVLRLLAGFPGKLLLVHCTGTEYSRPEGLVELARAHGRVPVVIAHLGRTDPPELVIELVRDSRAGNVYVDTSAMRDPAMVKKAVSAIGAERLLFGSDFPFYRPARIVELIRSSGVSERDLDLILRLNARSLLGLP